MTVQVFHSIAELRAALAGIRQSGCQIGLVPTMGALHAGHARLIETARRESQCVVVSIFVNPIQFDRGDDYDRYPRSLAVDVDFCAARGVDIVFAPTADEMYPQPERAFVEVTGVSDHLCGKFRPGHFRGVATVVLKLLNIVQPGRAYFGQKDAQQLAVIRRMASDLNVPSTIVGVPTVREPDGLALSSRNRLLSTEERTVAPLLHQALRAAEAMIAGGATHADEIQRGALPILERNPAIHVEYLNIVDPGDMRPVERVTAPVLIAAAIWIGKTRLIDNVLAVPGGQAAI